MFNILFASLILFSTETLVDSTRLDSVKTIYQTEPSRIKDSWLSPDKFMHFGISAGIVGLTYHTYVCRLKRDETEGKILSASLTGLLGLGKEIYDKKKKGHFSWKDLIFDGLGLGVGYLLFVYK